MGGGNQPPSFFDSVPDASNKIFCLDDSIVEQMAQYPDVKTQEVMMPVWKLKSEISDVCKCFDYYIKKIGQIIAIVENYSKGGSVNYSKIRELVCQINSVRLEIKEKVILKAEVINQGILRWMRHCLIRWSSTLDSDIDLQTEEEEEEELLQESRSLLLWNLSAGLVGEINHSLRYWNNTNRSLLEWIVEMTVKVMMKL